MIAYGLKIYRRKLNTMVYHWMAGPWKYASLKVKQVSVLRMGLVQTVARLKVSVVHVSTSKIFCQ